MGCISIKIWMFVVRGGTCLYRHAVCCFQVSPFKDILISAGRPGQWMKPFCWMSHRWNDIWNFFVYPEPSRTSLRFSFTWQICERQALIIVRTLELPSRAHSWITHWHLGVVSVGFWILLIISIELISFHYISLISCSHLTAYPALYHVTRTHTLPLLYSVLQAEAQFEYFSTVNKRARLFPLLFAIDLPPVARHLAQKNFSECAHMRESARMHEWACALSWFSFACVIPAFVCFPFLFVWIYSGLRRVELTNIQRNQYECKCIPLLPWLGNLVWSHFHAQKHLWNLWSEADNCTLCNLCSLMFSLDCNHKSALRLIGRMRAVYFHFPRTTYSAKKKGKCCNNVLLNSFIYLSVSDSPSISCLLSPLI